MNSTFKLTTAILLVVWINTNLYAFSSTVVLHSGGGEQFLKELSIHITKAINAMADNNWTDLDKGFTSEGRSTFVELVRSTNCRNVNPLYETKLIRTTDGNFEVRDIRVHIDLKNTKGNPYQYLVFKITPNGKIFDVQFAIENHHYQDILEEGERLEDIDRREYILSFLEVFRTAYNIRNLEFLKKVYSDDALIIVGKVLKKEPDLPDGLQLSSLSTERIQFIRLSKQEYLTSLERVFKKNEIIDINFEKVDLIRHPRKEDIYGVTLKQNWRSSTYSDEGYLFLMIDFRDERHPLIHVRSWQPEKFPDGSIVSLGDFELIE